jgi:hypothetical protein
VLWGRGVQKREESYRLYSCRGCSVSVSICGPRDHGNIFCAGDCAAVSRREPRRRAGARYQRTRRGARRHAARQQVWRERQLEKVTHLGCAPTMPVLRMSVTVDMAALELTDVPLAPDKSLEAPRTARRNPQRVAASVHATAHVAGLGLRLKGSDDQSRGRRRGAASASCRTLVFWCDQCSTVESTY